MRTAIALAVLILLAAWTLTNAHAGTIKASSGATARVNAQHAPKFQCLISGLERTGYRIDFMGGYRNTYIDSRYTGGRKIKSKHASGLAIDINQTGRNRVTRRLPANATQIASSCGLTHGAVWRAADSGHFEVQTQSAEGTWPRTLASQ